MASDFKSKGSVIVLRLYYFNLIIVCHALAMLERALVIFHVCPSVCPSHAGIESKLVTVGSCSFHQQVA